jgi:acylphosphatase
MSKKDDLLKPNLLTVHVIIRGMVQGVSFRANLRKRARELHVVGWARNLSDGSVEALLQGENSKIDLLREWCWIGPKSAKVDSVSVERVAMGKTYEDFSILF